MKKFVKEKSNFGKRLVKTTMFATALLVAVTMILSSGVTAAVGRGGINVAQQTQGAAAPLNQVKLQVATPASFDKHTMMSQQAPLGRAEVLFKFHHGYNNNAVGFNGAMTWEGAMRLTPVELSGYNGWNITTINYYYYDAVSINGKVKIYHGGSPTVPGALWEEVSFTQSTPGLKTTILPTPIPISGTEDIWVSIEWQQLAAGFPFGIDSGPAIDGKGDWIYYSGAWSEIQGLGLDYNWVLEALAEGALAPNDVGVTSITAPASGTATGPIIPKATVKNFGTLNQTNVPVSMNITAYGTPVSYFSDGFESYTLGSYGFPAGWTNTSINPTGDWYMYASTQTYSASTYPRVQEALSDGNAQDEQLISPIIDCSALTAVKLQFTKYFYASAAADATFTVYGSDNGGVNWNYTIVTYTTTSTTAENITIAWAAGQNDVRFKFRFESPADATLSSYLYFDNLWVGQFLGNWGPYGDNPPAGWTIQRKDTTAWDYSHWHRYAYTSYDCYGSAARMYYVTPYVEANDNLTSPSINCSTLSRVILQFNGLFYAYTTYNDKGYVQISVDGGDWQNIDIYQFVSPGSYGYAYNYEWYNGYDITALAAGQSDVKIRFQFTRPSGATSGYWYVDNVRVGDGSGTFVLCETFDTGKCVYYTGFKNYIHDNWGGIWDWKPVSMPYYNNKWQSVTSGTSPTCTPHGGLRMAQYYSYVYQGQKAMLYSIPINVAAANTLKMSFWMYHDTIAGAGKIQVLASHDGINWATMATFNRNDGSANGWYQHIVNLPGYEDDTALQIAFLGTSDYVAYMNIDDVNVFDPGLILVYSNTVNVDVAAGQTVQAVFPSWTPAAWHNLSNGDVTYDALAATHLTTDTVPENDAYLKTVVLHFPYLHDIAIASIDSPITNGPGQTQLVKATIANRGQYPERNFFVPVTIGAKIYTYTGTYNNFEADNGSFTVTGGLWTWGVPSGASPHSGTKCWATQPSPYPASQNAYLRTGAFTVPAGGDLTYWHWYYTETSYDGYNVKISTDNGLTWTLIYPVGGYTGTANSANPLYPEPIFCGTHNTWNAATFDLAAYEGQSVRFQFHFGCDSSVQYAGVFLDDMLVGYVTITIDEEYNESAAVTTWLNPGQTRQLTYSNWTPANLGVGTSGDIEYGVLADAQNAGDNNPGNNQMIHSVTLSYWHDVGVKKITSPVKEDRALLFHQRYFLPTESWTFRTSASGPGYLCQDDFWDLTAPIGNIEFWGLALIYSGGWTAGNPNTLPFEVKFYNDGGTSPGTVTNTFALPAMTPVNTGLTYSGFTMYKWTYDLPTAVPLADGWISIQSVTAPDNAWILWAGSPEGNLNMWQVGGTTPQIAGDCAFNLSGTSAPHPPVALYVPVGPKSVSAIVNNLGTFDESALTAYAEMWEYISDPNGTLNSTASVSGISLTALGGEETENFGDYTFALEGIYGLFVKIPLTSDNFPANNIKSLGIGCDATPPVTTISLSPAAPDGKNGWYVHDVTVTLTATDPVSHDVASGVASIKYKVDSEPEKTYTAPFKVTTDGKHNITYWAIDKVGNKEPDKLKALWIDETRPMVVLTKEVMLNKIVYTAVASDNMSGMWYVQFYLMTVLQFNASAPGPYTWTLSPIPHIEGYVKANAVDMAGNNASQADPRIQPYNQQSQQQQQSTQGQHYAKNR